VDAVNAPCQLHGVLAFCMVSFGLAVATLLPGVASGIALRYWVAPARAAALAEVTQSPSGLILLESPSLD